VQYLAPFAFPLWLIGFPAVMYWRGGADGPLPTSQEWESAAHSSGPWVHNIGILWLLSFVFGAIVHLFAITTCLQLRQRLLATIWAVGLATFFLGEYWFGYLME
jgi:hypothetical protein